MIISNKKIINKQNNQMSFSNPLCNIEVMFLLENLIEMWHSGLC